MIVYSTCTCRYDVASYLMLRIVMPKTRGRKPKVSTRLSSRRKKTLQLPKCEDKDTSPTQSTGPSSTLKDQEPPQHSGPTASIGIGPSLVKEFRLLCTDGIKKNPESYKKYARDIKKYMRNQFDFFGFKAPERRKLQKQLIDKNKELLKDREVLFSFLRELWLQDERDFQCFGVDLCQQFRQEMLGTTNDQFREAVAEVKVCLTSKSWWDTVDSLAYIVIGYFVKERPVLGVPLMDEWINDDNMWLRRVAILHQLNWKADTDEDRLFSMYLCRAHEDEFFIRKSIGWALRTYSRTNGPAVRNFVEKNRESLSGLSIREALKYC